MTLFLLLYEKIVQLSLMGSLIVVCILLTKLIMKDRIGIKFQYAVWFILILRLLLLFTPSSSLSVYNYVPTKVPTYMSTDVSTDMSTNISFDESMTMNIPALSTSIDESTNANSIEKKEHTTITFLTLVTKALPFIWIAGVCMIGLAMFIINGLFMKRIKKCPRIKDQKVLSILNECKDLMNISKDIYLVETNWNKTPCVLNFIEPIIMIPAKSLEECNLIHLKYILLHELAHVKRKDIFVNYIVSFLCIIYWFNPLIWYGFHKMREDREICCDSLALSVLGEDEVTNYGFTIIKLAEVSLRAPYLPAVAGIINKKSKIKRRIIKIKLFKKNSYRITATALAVLIIAGTIFLTGETKTKAGTDGDMNTKADTTEESKTKADTNEYTIKITDRTETTNTKAETIEEFNSTADTFGKPTTEIVDGVDCTFIDDQDAIGTWETVDLVKNFEDFVPNVKSWPEDFYLLRIQLLPNGEMPKNVVSTSERVVACHTWTKGYIINHLDKTAGKYTIKEIDGIKYMFWEWKNGDYIRDGLKPYYYVLKQVE